MSTSPPICACLPGSEAPADTADRVAILRQLCDDCKASTGKGAYVMVAGAKTHAADADTVADKLAKQFALSIGVENFGPRGKVLECWIEKTSRSTIETALDFKRRIARKLGQRRTHCELQLLT
jgi:hypothetical protein